MGSSVHDFVDDDHRGLREVGPGAGAAHLPGAKRAVRRGDDSPAGRERDAPRVACLPWGKRPPPSPPEGPPDAATAHQPQPQRPSLLFGNLYTVVSDSCTWWPWALLRHFGKRHGWHALAAMGLKRRRAAYMEQRDGAPLRAAYGRSAGWRPGCAGRRLSEASADLTGGRRVRGDTQNEDRLLRAPRAAQSRRGMGVAGPARHLP